ncbi:MAG: SCO family protein [Gammaproteobacteria bacterium]
MRWWIGPLTLVTLVAVGISIGAWRDKTHSSNQSHTAAQPFNPIQAGTYLTEPKPLPPFHLMASDGKPFTEDDLKNYWSFVFFGYTRCPELCPKTLGVMQQLAEQLGPHSSTRFVLVSIDPEHDTPNYLKQYFNAPPYHALPFRGATGERTELSKLTNILGLYLQEGHVPFNGHLEHSGALLLINPQGEFTALFNNPDNPDQIARDFQRVMQLYVHSTS